MKDLESLQKLQKEIAIGHSLPEVNGIINEIQYEIFQWYVPVPLFEDGEPVRIGDQFENNLYRGPYSRIDDIYIHPNGSFDIIFNTHKFSYAAGERVKRPVVELEVTDSFDDLLADIRLSPLEYCIKHKLPQFDKNLIDTRESLEWEKCRDILDRYEKMCRG